MKVREQGQPQNRLTRLVTHLRLQLGEVARECSRAGLACTHFSHRTNTRKENQS